jgi:hypothetical protein
MQERPRVVHPARHVNKGVCSLFVGKISYERVVDFLICRPSEMHDTWCSRISK